MVMGAKATKEYAPTARQVLSRRAIDKNLKQSFGERAPSGVTEELFRFKEEAEIREKFGKTPTKMTGSLTEGQLFDVLKGVRDKPKTFSAQKISEDFEISVEAAAAIIKCARFPKLETSTESIEMFIAK